MSDFIKRAIDFCRSLLMKLGFSSSIADNILAGILVAIGGLMLTRFILKPLYDGFKRAKKRYSKRSVKNPLGDNLEAIEKSFDHSISKEIEYLRWIANEMKTISQQWHETPIIPTPAHTKKALGFREKMRALLYRHNPSDYLSNPALNDSDLLIRAGFGKRVKIKDLARELRKYTKIVVLGDPGSGKSVCMRQLAYDLAEMELKHHGPMKTLPIFVDMGSYDGWENKETLKPMPILEFLKSSMASHDAIREAPTTHSLLYISQNLEHLLQQGRVICIFDALDEMPQEGYQERFQSIKKFMSTWEPYDNRFIYSCRSLDYDPAFNVDEVIIDPFDHKRIYGFLHKHVPIVSNALYQHITDDESISEIVSNPFFLQALAYINSPSTGTTAPLTMPRIPDTRGELIRVFVETLLNREAQDKQREHLEAIPGGIDTLRRFLSELAFHLQEGRQVGSSVRLDFFQDLSQPYPDWEKLLWIARRARILGKRGEPADLLAETDPSESLVPGRVEFVHHRLQEFFAAEELARRLAKGWNVEQYLEDIWWQETVILAIGIVSNPRPILERILAARKETDEWIEKVVRYAPYVSHLPSTKPRIRR
jgi:NACHT domain